MMKNYNVHIFDFNECDIKRKYATVNYFQAIEDHLNEIKTIIESTTIFSRVEITSTNVDKESYVYDGGAEEKVQYYTIDCYVGSVLFFRIVYNITAYDKINSILRYNIVLGFSIQPEIFATPYIRLYRTTGSGGSSYDSYFTSFETAFKYNYGDNHVHSFIRRIVATDDVLLISSGYDNNYNQRDAASEMHESRVQLCICKSNNGNTTIIFPKRVLNSDSDTPPTDSSNVTHCISNASKSTDPLNNIFFNSVFKAGLTTLSYFPVCGDNDYITSVMYTPTSQIMFSNNSSLAILTIAGLKYLYTGWFAIPLD